MYHGSTCPLLFWQPEPREAPPLILLIRCHRLRRLLSRPLAYLMYPHPSKTAKTSSLSGQTCLPSCPLPSKLAPLCLKLLPDGGRAISSNPAPRWPLPGHRQQSGAAGGPRPRLEDPKNEQTAPPFSVNARPPARPLHECSTVTWQ